MNREFIEEIIARIKAELPIFKKVGLFNDDFNKHSLGVGNQINFPAIFLSFPEEVVYKNKTVGLQETEEFIIRFNIGMKFVTDKDLLNIFDTKQSVYKVFHKFKPENCSSMSRYAENTDEDREGFYVFEQDYTVRMIDNEASLYVDGSLQTVTLDLETDLKIEPLTVDGVRTDKIIER